MSRGTRKEAAHDNARCISRTRSILQQHDYDRYDTSIIHTLWGDVGGGGSSSQSGYASYRLPNPVANNATATPTRHARFGPQGDARDDWLPFKKTRERSDSYGAAGEREKKGYEFFFFFISFLRKWDFFLRGNDFVKELLNCQRAML